MTPEQAIQILSAPSPINERAFELLRVAATQLGDRATERVGQQLVIRMLDRADELRGFSGALAALVRQTGLFPYLSRQELSFQDRVALEVHRPRGLGDGVVFHRAQAAVYRELSKGRNVILSAPTSFGKSLIIDAVLAEGRHNNVLIVVPTLALMDETRRRLGARFRAQYKVITHPSQQRGERNVFVMTQERAAGLAQPDDVTLLVIDEFYKLDPRREEGGERAYLLNQILYRYSKRECQFYLLGPNIDQVPEALKSELKCTFISTDFATVVSELVYVTKEPSAEAALVDLCRNIDDATLIYCSSPPRSRDVAKVLLESGLGSAVPELAEAASWIANNYHPEWLLSKAIRQGIGIHHGRLPRALAQFMVKSFNDGHLKFLICTSTLIEGVNTRAKNVVIYDHKVGARKFDFFTFSNIKGRSGRMRQHYVGKVFLFHDPPAEQLAVVDVPVVTQGADVAEHMLLQMDWADLTKQSQDRLQPVLQQTTLPVEVIRENIGIDPNLQIGLAEELLHMSGYELDFLLWRGMPSFDQLRKSCEAIWSLEPGKRAGVVSASQLCTRVWHLYAGRGVKALIDKQLARTGGDPDEVVEYSVEFVRQWAQYTFPRFLRAAERIVHHIAERRRRSFPSYGAFASQIENLFEDPIVTALDEYGIPFQVGQRLSPYLNAQGDIDLALSRLQRLDLARFRLTQFEAALIADVKNTL